MREHRRSGLNDGDEREGLSANRPAISSENVQWAKNFIESMSANFGGTQIYEPVENSLKKSIILMKNEKFPFFDTSISSKVDLINSVSLLNIQSINDFQKKINKKIEIPRFRGNLYIDGLDAWEERNWIGKIIKINNTSFKVERNIPRCVVINLKPKTDENSLNLLKSLKKKYNHFDMGVYLRALSDGKVKVGDTLKIES